MFGRSVADEGKFETHAVRVLRGTVKLRVRSQQQLAGPLAYLDLRRYIRI
jgi:hypothetical protein